MNNEIEYTVRAEVNYAMLLTVKAKLSQYGNFVNMTVTLDNYTERKRKSIKSLLNSGLNEEEAVQRSIEELVNAMLGVEHETLGDIFLELAGDALYYGGEVCIEILPMHADVTEFDMHRDRIQPCRVLLWQRGTWVHHARYRSITNAFEHARWAVQQGLTDHARVECYWHLGYTCDRGIRAVYKRHEGAVWCSRSARGVMSEDDLTTWERIG
jgi:hypothetical protein